MKTEQQIKLKIEENNHYIEGCKCNMPDMEGWMEELKQDNKTLQWVLEK